MKSRRGMTLVEVMVAGAILTLLTLCFFEGVTLATRIAHDNAELMQAEGVAWDAVWMTFNEDYDDLLAKCPATRTVVLSQEAAPDLTRHKEQAILQITTSKIRQQIDGRLVDFISIEGDVEWGPSSRRRRLSDTQRTFVYRGPLSRVEVTQ